MPAAIRSGWRSGQRNSEQLCRESTSARDASAAAPGAKWPPGGTCPQAGGDRGERQRAGGRGASSIAEE